MLDKLKTLFTIDIFNKEHDMKTTEVHNKLKDIHQEIKELIMAGKLDEDFPAFMDMWEEMAEIDMLLTDWDGDSKYVQRRLINAEMARIDEEDNV